MKALFEAEALCGTLDLSIDCPVSIFVYLFPCSTSSDKECQVLAETIAQEDLRILMKKIILLP